MKESLSQNIKKEVFKEAVKETSELRKSYNNIENRDKYIQLISEDKNLALSWERYQKNFDYAQNVSWEDALKSLNILSSYLK